MFDSTVTNSRSLTAAHRPGSGTVVPLSSFVGREREVAEVQRYLAATRLLTLTGPGGVGKTRLALEVARELDGGELFSDGVWFAGLASLADAGLVAQETAAALGVREEAGRPIVETMQDALRPRRLRRPRMMIRCFALRLLGDVAARQGNAEHARTLFEASLAHGREVGRWLAAWPAINLAHLLTEQHDDARARALLREALITYRDAGDREGVARSLEGWARLAASEGLAAQAMRLAGAAAALRAAADAPLPSQDASALDRHLARTRATLSPPPFRSVHGHGIDGVREGAPRYRRVYPEYAAQQAAD
jgi:hypothetical protein